MVMRVHFPGGGTGVSSRHRSIRASTSSSCSGVGICAAKASVDLFGPQKDDFIPRVTDIISVGDVSCLATGGRIVFT